MVTLMFGTTGKVASTMLQIRVVVTAAILACAILSAPALAAKATDSIRVTGGLITGVDHGDIVTFKGIPYAAPPIGPPTLARASTGCALERRTRCRYFWPALLARNSGK